MAAVGQIFFAIPLFVFQFLHSGKWWLITYDMWRYSMLILGVTEVPVMCLTATLPQHDLARFYPFFARSSFSPEFRVMLLTFQAWATLTRLTAAHITFQTDRPQEVAPLLVGISLMHDCTGVGIGGLGVRNLFRGVVPVTPWGAALLGAIGGISVSVNTMVVVALLE